MNAMDDLDIPTFALPAELEQQLQADRRPALERTGPRSTQTDEAAVAERDNNGRIFPSRRLGRVVRSGKYPGEPRTCAAHGDFLPCMECKRINDRRAR